MNIDSSAAKLKERVAAALVEFQRETEHKLCPSIDVDMINTSTISGTRYDVANVRVQLESEY